MTISPEQMRFTFSDTIAGYVTTFDRDKDTFKLKTSDGREYTVKLKGSTYAQFVRNLGDPYHDATGQIREMLTKGRFVFVYGVFYPEHGGYNYEAQFLVFVGRKPGEYVFENPDWWVRQIIQLGDFYLAAQFPSGVVNYDDYRTTITLTGDKESDNYRQETDTISRLVYGFASAFLLTGDDRYLEGAEKGTEYLREHMRFYDRDEHIVYWYHGIDVRGKREDKVFASEFGDDFDAIPAYEQIYALAGPIQTYRITGDPRILRDAELTVELFDRFFLDREKGGYFSHLDP
ncbi:MAG: AGE family epimerase/isomerase, partial [Chloroflexi bacterium]|nr:AGE family epimerase/isomerase [Chloroflexota bacterium]